MAAHAGDAGFDVHVDFGASDGFAAAGFSRSVRARRTLGVEPDALSATLGREYLGVETVPDLAGARAELPAGARVLLTMNQVVEHLLDLRGPLDPSRLHGLDAWLYVEVPDAARYRRARDFHIAHLHHFSASSLRHLLEGLGWELLALDSYRRAAPAPVAACAGPPACSRPAAACGSGPHAPAAAAARAHQVPAARPAAGPGLRPARRRALQAPRPRRSRRSAHTLSPAADRIHSRPTGASPA